RQAGRIARRDVDVAGGDLSFDGDGLVTPGVVAAIPLVAALDLGQRPLRIVDRKARAFGRGGDDAEGGGRVFRDFVAGEIGTDADDARFRADPDRGGALDC